MIRWHSIYVHMMAKLMTQQVMETGVMSITYHAKSLPEAQLIEGMHTLFQGELLRLGRWRDGALVVNDWREMQSIWKRKE